ncbi:MAG: sodium:solute symporter [Melioribacteraceae bacterium]|nr:sodium:solute symporter [Candidatus Cloacimonadota bacterium]MCF8241082.1 sodium:solute symporter [Melioribacteraceae bacterium]MCF8354507.1 sodium:solute symporter [Melioribacteraceae bacterium]MCF8394276.1 sodium:solute symporter [Melioribacteraceae bacterium]MCF8418176.1 sodium:solute symporter [Melioribacteraceae bacterium]
MNIASDELVIAGWILISLYAASILVFVVRGAIKTKSMKDYAVGNIAFSPAAVGLALAASMTSAATFIINPGIIAFYGISGVISYAFVLPVAAMVSLVVLTKGFRKHGSTVKALSMAQWMGTRYNSKGYSLFFAFLSLLLITFIVLIAVGLTKVLSKTLNVGELLMLIGIVVFIFGYMMFGGANSMVYTNTIQAILMLVVAFILLGSGYEHFSSGVHGFLDELAAIDPKLVSTTNDSSFLFRDYFEIFFAQIVVGVAIVCQPHIITKSLLLKTDSDVNKYLVFGVITEFIFFLVVIAGLYARLVFPGLTVDGKALALDGIISAYVVKEFPVYVGLLVVLGLISAGISTLEGLIQALATTISADIAKPLFGNKYPGDNLKREKFEIGLNRVVIAILGIVTILISYDQLVNPKLSVAIFAQNGVYAYFSAAFVPILFGMFLKGVDKVVAIGASVTAVIVHFSYYYGKLPVPFTASTGENPGVAAAMAIVASLIVGYVLYRFTWRTESV